MIGAVIRIAVVSIAVLVTGIAVALHAPFVRRKALALAESTLEKSVRGDVSLGRLEGILLHRATLRDVEIRDQQGRPVIQADMVRVDPDLVALIRDGVLRFENVHLVGPRIHLRTDEQGKLNLSELFVAKTSTPTGEKSGFAPLPIDLQHVRIIDGTVWYHPHGGQVQRVEDIDLSANAEIRSERIDAAILDLSVSPTAYPSRVHLHGRATVLPKSVSIPELSASDTLGSSAWFEKVAHELDSGATSGRFQLTGSSKSLRALTKMEALRGSVVLKGNVSHAGARDEWVMESSGKLNDAPLTLNARASADFVELSADLDLRGPIDPSELFAGAPTGPLQGTISASLEDADPKRLTGAVRARLTGALKQKGQPIEVRGLELDATAKAGRLDAVAKVDSDRAKAKLSASGGLEDLDLRAEVDASKVVPRVDRVRLVASGKAQANRARVTVERLEVQALDHPWKSKQESQIDATQSKRGWTVKVRDLNLASAAGSVTLSAHADVGRKKLRSAKLQVARLDVARIQKSLDMTPQVPGKVDANLVVRDDRDVEGTVAMTLKRKRVLEAKLDLASPGLAKLVRANGTVDVKVDEFPLSLIDPTLPASATGDASVVKKGRRVYLALRASMIRDGFAGRVVLDARGNAPADPSAPGAWQKLGLDALQHATVKLADVDLTVWKDVLQLEQANGIVSADVDVSAGARRVRGTIDLERLELPRVPRSFDLRASVDSREGRTDVHADLFDAERPVVVVEARLPRDLLQLSKTTTTAMMRLPLEGEMHADRLPLQLVAAALNAGDAAGSISWDGRLTGSIHDPLFYVELSSDDAAIRTAKFQKIEGHAELTRVRLTSKMHMQQHQGGKLDLDAKLGLGKDMLVGGHLEAARFDLGFLSLLAPKTKGTLGGVEGKLDANISLSGTRTDPHLQGEVKIAGLQGVMQYPIPPVEDTSLDLRFKEDKVIFGIEGRSGDGSFEITGNGSMPSLNRPRLSGKIQLKDLSIAAGPRLVETDLEAQWHAVSRDNLIEADVIIVDGSARMESGAEKLAPIRRFDNVVIVEELGREVGPKPGEEEAPVELVKTKTKVRLTVRTDGAIPLHSDEVDATVQANLVVETGDQGAIATGAVTVGDGTVTLFGGRRWVIERAEIRFPGGAQEEPTLNVRIYHDFSDVVVFVDVTGKPSRPEIRFSSDPGTYSRDQLLGFVLGGSPDAAPSDATLGEQATGLAAGFIAGQIQSRIKDKLPIDTLSVDFEDGARASSVLVGKWITERLFVAYNYRIEARDDENASEGMLRVLFGHGWMLEAAFGDRGNGGADVLWITRF